MEVCPDVVEGIGHDPRPGIFRTDFEPVFLYDRAADLRSEGPEGLLDMRQVGVYVQMVRIHCRDNGNFRMKLQEGPVELIGFSHHYIVSGSHEIASGIF